MLKSTSLQFKYCPENTKTVKYANADSGMHSRSCIQCGTHFCCTFTYFIGQEK